MDLEALLTEVYVMVDDWYKAKIAVHKGRRGRPGQLSDSEVLTLEIVGQWRVGVPWQSQRGMVRYAQEHLRTLFPAMIGRSSFNYRSRRLYGVMARLQGWLAAQGRQKEDIYECADCLPIPAYSSGQATKEKQHWLQTATKGRGGYGWYFGHRLLATVTASGIVTGWVLGSAHIQDRWLLEALLSARLGSPQVVGPPPLPTHARKSSPPVAHLGPWETCGSLASPVLADMGFNGFSWQRYWVDNYRTKVITAPGHNVLAVPLWTTSEKRWLASHRQIIETVFARLTTIFGIKESQAHSLFGLYARLTAKMVAYNIGVLINRRLGRPDGALATLLC